MIGPSISTEGMIVAEVFMSSSCTSDGVVLYAGRRQNGITVKWWEE
jgi:hypothetical protein